jgi:hypothetical protein
MARLTFPEEIKVHRGHSHFGSIVLRNGGKTISGFQFDLHYNSEALTITPSLGPAASNAMKEISFNILLDGTLRVVVIGLNQTEIGDGVVVVLSAQATSECEERSYPLDVTNASGTTPDGDPVAIRSKSGSARFRQHDRE